MTTLEHNICIIAEGLQSSEIESLISELQIIADRKYQEKESTEMFTGTMDAINNLSIFK